LVKSGAVILNYRIPHNSKAMRKERYECGNEAWDCRILLKTSL